MGQRKTEQVETFAWLLSPTQQRKKTIDDARLREEELAREEERSLRDPADLARIFIPEILPLQVFTDHQAELDRATKYDESWLRSMPFLKQSPYLQPLVQKVKSPIFKERSLQEQKDALLPWRPNVMQVFYPYIVSILLDAKRWVPFRSKFDDNDNFFISQFNYGDWMNRWIGERYESIAQRILIFEDLVGKRKQLGQHVQEYERDMGVTGAMKAKALWIGMDATEEDNVKVIYEAGKKLLIAELRPLSILSRSEYKFLYNVGNLVVAFLGKNFLDVGREMPEIEKERLISACLT